MVTDTISREQALLLARAQRDIHLASENLAAIADELGEVIAAVEGAVRGFQLAAERLHGTSPSNGTAEIFTSEADFLMEHEAGAVTA